MADSAAPGQPGCALAGGGCALIIVALFVLGLFVGGGDHDDSPTATSAPERQPPEPEAAPEEDLGNGEVAAMLICPEPIERLAQYSSRWTDGFLDPKFSHYRRTADPDVFTHIGDWIEFQNGFGAWVPHVYECDVNVRTNEVTEVRASPGRIPR